MTLTMLIGFLLAVFIDQKVRGESVLRTIFLYPYAMSFVATGFGVAVDLEPGTRLQSALRQMGLTGFTFDWIVTQDKVIYTVAFAAVWQASGLVMALLLAGLRGVDEEIWKGVANRRHSDLARLPEHRAADDRAVGCDRVGAACPVRREGL